MNISSGGLSFDFTATNDNLVKIVEQSKEEIQGLADASKRGGAQMDAAFKQAAAKLDTYADQMSDAMSQQRQAIIALEKEMASLKTKAGQQFSSGDVAASQASMEVYRAKERELKKRKECIQACYDGLDVLEQERQRLEGLRQASETASNAQASLRSQLRQVREQLAQMEATQGVGVRQTEEFKALQQEAGRLADALADAQAQVRIFSDDNALITGAIAGISGVAGAFSAAQGAMSLFGVENDKVQQAMLKVQSLMAITTGLQQVANALNKDSAFQLVVVRKAKELLAAANLKLATSLGISTAAAQLLMATLTLGLSVAITAIIVAISKFQSKQAEAKKAADEFNKKVAEAAGKPVAAYHALQAEWLSLSDSLKDREKWIANNANRFEELGFKVRTVADVEDILIKNSGKFVEAMMVRAKALAAQEFAVDAYKEVIKAQEAYDKVWKIFVDTGKGTYVDGYGTTRKTNHKMEKSSEWKEAEEELERAKSVYNKYAKMQAEFTQEETALLNSIGHSTTEVVEGSVTEAEKELNRLKGLYNDAATDVERADLATKIAEQQAKLDQISLKTTSGTGNKKKTEAEKFAEELKKKKALYQQYIAWATSSDATVREAAATEFMPLLESGKTYLAFLESQRDSISQKATKTTLDLQKLQMLNNEIAEATKEAVITDFQKQLEADLKACNTLGAMLDLIERRRQEIAGDQTGVGDQKRDVLKDAEDDTKKQIESETAQLLSTYASYEAERLKFAESYARKRQLLERNLANAQTDEQRAAAQAALDGLEEENRKWQRSKTGLYAQLLDEYKTHEQKLAEIQTKYAKERAEASANGNISMLQLINQKEQEEISKLAANQLMASASWNQLFGDISRLGTSTINRLIKEIEANKLTLSAQLNPADLKAVNDQLERARQEIQQRNPFLALKDSLADLRRAMNERKLLSDKQDPIIQELEDRKKTYEAIAAQLADPITAPTVAVDFKTTLDEGTDFADYLKRRIQNLQGLKIKLGAEFTGKHELDVLIAMLNKVQGTGKSVGQGLKDSFSDAASSIQFISGCFDAVVNGMKKMGVQMDEETEAILGDIGGIMEGAQNVAQGIATGNPLSIIQGSITLFSSAFDLFNSRDRKAEKSIKKHEEALGRLKNAYNELQHAVSKALGEEVYRNQNSLIANLRKQQRELSGMMADERSKKHTDNSKIEEWREQYAELGRQITDIIDEITQSITQTTATDLAGDLADALVEAFEGGEDAAKAFGEVADSVIKKAVVNALKLQLLEKPLQNAIKQLQKDMGFDEEGNGSFDGLTEEEQKRFKAAVEAAGANFQRAMDMYKDLFEQLDDSDPTTLSGAIKGASQESIDLLAGQTNAVRQNQVTSLGLLRQQLIHLSNIDANVGVIAGRLLSILNNMNGSADSSLRSQGLTD